jgi:indolepyruvate ferredoxin oxidoreductase beta subunit
VFWINATEKAKELGNPAVIGVVMLGALSSLVGGEESAWLNVIKRMVPERFVDLNLKAFEAGRQIQLA